MKCICTQTHINQEEKPEMKKAHSILPWCYCCRATGGTPPGCCVGTTVPSKIVESGLGTRHHSSAAPPPDILPACLPASRFVRGPVRVPQSCSYLQTEQDTQICSCSTLTAGPSSALRFHLTVTNEIIKINLFSWLFDALPVYLSSLPRNLSLTAQRLFCYFFCQSWGARRC